MDYEKLFIELPKEPIKWTVSDILIWLKFIGLESFYPKFKQLAIDGSILSSLTEEDLRDQLHIKSSITIKKVMSWVTKGLKEYENHLREYKANSQPLLDMREITMKPKIAKKSSVQQEPILNNNYSHLSGSLKHINEEKNMPTLKPIKNMSMQAMVAEDQMMEDEQGQKRKQFQLIIQQQDGPQNSFFSVKELGAKIGRHSSNQILILDESISRYHAEVIFMDGIFYLKDTGSTTGTFIKITQKCQILADMIFEMGSNQFQAHFHNSNLLLSIIQGPSLTNVPFEIPKHRISIGRKQNNELSFPDDQHLSNNHANIFYMDGKYYLEDLATTNGTWRRLSGEAEQSELFEILDKTVFKIGSNQTYSCKIKTAMVVDKTNPNACIICYENDKDCVYMPCKHNTACIKCSKNLKECPICRIKIQDFIRIYRS